MITLEDQFILGKATALMKFPLDSGPIFEFQNYIFMTIQKQVVHLPDFFLLINFIFFSPFFFFSFLLPQFHQLNLKHYLKIIMTTIVHSKLENLSL